MQVPIIIQVFGYAASVLIPLAFLPQTIKTLRTQVTSNLSVIGYSVYWIGVFLFLIFGILINDIPMIICQVLTLILTTAIVMVIIKNLILEKQRGKNGNI